MNRNNQERFDRLLDGVLEALPAISALLEEVPLIVEDRPSRELLMELGDDPDDQEAALDYCGLHTGVPYTDASVEDSGGLPPEIRLFREGIVAHAEGWEPPEGGEDRVREEIRITLLHEIGHQFGLDEDDLEELGYE